MSPRSGNPEGRTLAQEPRHAKISPTANHADHKPRGVGLNIRAGSRRRDIQGLRAVAVLMVAGYHAGLPMPGGFVGVDVFFVISGFVITLMLRREWLLTGRIRLARFYARRFKRLTPALALVVSITVVMSAFLLSPWGSQQAAAKTGTGAILLVANYVIAMTTGGYFDLPAETNPLLNTWSLSVEEQFYLAFPFLLLLGWMAERRFRHLNRVVVALVLAVGLASFALALYGSHASTLNGESPLLAAVNRPFASMWDAGAAILQVAPVPTDGLWLLGFYSPLTRAWEFAVGALLALTIKHVEVRTQASGAVTGILGILLLVASIWLISDSVPFPGLATVLPVLGTSLVIVAGSQPMNLVSRAMATRPLVKVGDWSYSIYLWHWPFIVFATILWSAKPLVLTAAVAVSFVPAITSYRYLERPIHQIGTAGPWKMAAIVLPTLVIPLVLSSVLARESERGWGNQEVVIAATAQRLAHKGWDECMGNPTDGLRACEMNSDSARPPIYLVGDSNAAQWVEAADGAARQLDRPLTVTTQGGCPLIDVFPQEDWGSATSEALCQHYYDSTLSRLEESRPGTVIVAQSSGRWTVDGQEEMTRELESELRSTLERIQAMGHEVVLVLPVLRFDEPGDFLTLDKRSMWSIAREGTAAVIPQDQINPRQVEVASIVRRVAARSGVPLVDASREQCAAGLCGLQHPDGYPIYMDVAHISVPYSEAYAEEFADAIDLVMGQAKVQ